VALPQILVIASFASSASAANCAFHYSKSIRDSVVLPQLSRTFGSASKFFDADRPAVYRRSGNINISLLATRHVDGQEFLFEDAFVIVVDPCTKVVVQAYTTQKYHKE